MKYLPSLLLGLALAWPPFTAVALGPIVITPTRTPQSENPTGATVYVVTREQIEQSGAVTTSQLLRGIPGVQIDDLFGNGTDVTISVRGFSSTANANTLVLVDGRRLNHSDTAGPDLHHVFPKDIERIEVMVGSAGSLYGDQAVGGVVNIITRDAGETRQQLSGRVGSFGYRGLGFSSSSEIRNGLAYRISAEIFEADHYRDNNSEENTNFSGILDYADADSRYFVELQEIRDELELPGALLETEFDEDPTQSFPTFSEDFIDEDTSVLRLGYERRLADHRFAIDTTRRETDADLRQSFRSGASPADGFSRRENSSLNPKLSGTWHAGYEVPYVVGIDLEQTEFEIEIPNIFGVAASSNDQTNESIYLQINPRLTEALRLTFGARRSSVENEMTDIFSFPAGIEVDDDISVYELGLAYRIDEGTRVTARIDENFRFAKVNELALAAPAEILETQTGESRELGVELERGRQRLIASLYRLDLKNEIEFDPNAGLFGENVNLDDTRRDGLTLLLISQITSAFTLMTEIGLVDAKFRSGSFDGNEISGVSDEIARLTGNYGLDDAWNVFVEWHYRSPRHIQGDNANELDKLGSITVINAGVDYRYKAWNANLRINNLADETYAEFVSTDGFTTGYQPSPGRNVVLGVAYRFE